MTESTRQSFLAEHNPDTPTTNRRPNLEGIEVGHMRNEFHAYGGRSRQGDHLAHMNNTEPGARGWLGNPYLMDGGDQEAERRRVIHAFLLDFMARVENEPAFRQAVEDLRGQRVACWCRGACQRRHAGNWCHLDVVAAYLDGDMEPVHEYLRGDENPDL